MVPDFFIFRNFTVENLFKKFNAHYSGYGDISEVPEAKSYIWFYLPPVKINQQELLSEINDFQSKIQLLLSNLGNKTCIAFTAEVLFPLTFENRDPSVSKAIWAYNDLLYTLVDEHPNLKIINFSDFVQKAPLPILDWKYYYISQSLITPKLNASFNEWFERKLAAIQSKRKKCLVLDLDNTLWGGILGEDGIEGIKIGDTYPGLAFRDFQESILEAANNGVILAVCSKNNEEDVLDVWEKHPYLILRQKHISAYRINWQDKATNIQELADELNIGLDSMVFIDDNPAERTRVQQTIPEVVVPDFPEHPHQMSAFFKDVYERYFQIYSLTNEDKSKTQQYTANAERNSVKKAFTNIDAYLESLSMELDVYHADKFTVTRIAQMTQKTNQFNLTTRRYSEDDIQNFLQAGHLVLCLGIKDKFGDNGITVATIIKIEEKIAIIDSFLLSCRVLGRGIETAFIDFLLNDLKGRGVEKVFAEYIPSQKNKQTENFYDKNGFELKSINANNGKHYELKLDDLRVIKKYYQFKVISND